MIGQVTKVPWLSHLFVTLSTSPHRNNVMLTLIPRLTYKSQLTHYIPYVWFGDSLVEPKKL